MKGGSLSYVALSLILLHLDSYERPHLQEAEPQGLKETSGRYLVHP